MEINERLRLKCLVWRLYDQEGLGPLAIHKYLAKQVTLKAIYWWLFEKGNGNRLQYPVEDQIAVIFLNRVLGYSVADIGQLYGIPQSTPYNILSRWNIHLKSSFNKLDVAYTKDIMARAREFFTWQELEDILHVSRPTIMAWWRGRSVFVKNKLIFEALENRVIELEAKRSGPSGPVVVEYIRGKRGPKVRSQ